MNEKIVRIDLDGVNCYLVKSNGSFVLFDTGGPLFMDKHFNNRRNQLVKELESVEKLKRYDITTVYPGHENPFTYNELR